MLRLRQCCLGQAHDARDTGCRRGIAFACLDDVLQGQAQPVAECMLPLPGRFGPQRAVGRRQLSVERISAATGATYALAVERTPQIQDKPVDLLGRRWW